MVYYIRFLKAPTFTKKDKRKATIKSVLTITSDLGDQFYSTNLGLYVRLVWASDRADHVYQWTWQSGMRALPIEFSVEVTTVLQLVELQISTCEQFTANKLDLDNMPEIMSAGSNIRGYHGDVGGEQKIVRCLDMGLGETRQLYIKEDAGDSIARHIWDAGLGLVAYLLSFFQAQSVRTSSLADSPMFGAKPLKVLELGSGCGVVGIALAQMRRHCDVLLTDLPEAMEILEQNIQGAQLAIDSQLKAMVLDWDQDVPISIRNTSFDLVLVSDCTYNSDSLPALVRTLSTLTSYSHDVCVVVSMKVRHSSESIFFELMSNDGFVELKHNSVTLPDTIRSHVDEPLEVIEIYSFQHCEAWKQKTDAPLHVSRTIPSQVPRWGDRV